MADGQPEMIPMPENPPRGEQAPELSRQLSPDEERSALLNFMGSMYGETKKIDGNIVGESTTLQRGKSEELRRQIEQVYAQPQQSVPQQVQAAPIPDPPVQKLSVPTQVESIKISNNDPQLSFNFEVSEKEDLLNQVHDLVKKVNLQTKQIKELNDKIDIIIDKITTTSLPIRKQTKKKSVDK
jgi:hypothetical protein